MAIVGYAGVKKSGRIFGYAYDDEEPSRTLAVDVRVSGRTVATLTCDQPSPSNVPPGAPPACGFDLIPSDVADDWLSGPCDLVVLNTRTWINRDPWFIRKLIKVDGVKVHPTHALIVLAVPGEFQAADFIFEVDGAPHAPALVEIDRSSLTFRIDRAEFASRSSVRVSFSGEPSTLLSEDELVLDWPPGNHLADPGFSHIEQGSQPSDVGTWSAQIDAGATVERGVAGGIELTLEAGTRVSLQTLVDASGAQAAGEFYLRGNVLVGEDGEITISVLSTEPGETPRHSVSGAALSEGIRFPIDLSRSRGRLEIAVEASSTVTIELLEAGYGPPGFDPALPARGSLTVPSLVVPAISKWDLPQRAEGQRQLDLAEGLRFSCKPNASGLTMYAAPLEPVRSGEGFAGPGFGLAISGEFSGSWYRLEYAVAGEMTAPAPGALEIVAARLPSSRLRRNGPRISKVLLIQQSQADDGAMRDRTLAVLAHNLPVPDTAHPIDVPVPARTWQSAQRELLRSADPDSKLVIALEFSTRATEFVVSAPTFQRQTKVVDALSAQPDFEDAHLRAQAQSFVRQLDPASSPEDAAVDTPSPCVWRGDAYSVDIVIPVHNGGEHVERCLRSIELTVDQPHRLVLVDDASGEETKVMLERYAAARPWVTLIRNNANLGYTRSSNLGLGSGSSDYVVLLNSDTICTRGWLRRLVQIAASDPSIGAVGPLSNAASAQSVPRARDARNHWAVNELPPGVGIQDFADFVASISQCECPEVPLLNGFCTLFQREALRDVGFLDEVAFPMGYGEENDLCYRLTTGGYKLIVADDVYIYHVKSVSFGDKQKSVLSKSGAAALRAKHPDMDIYGIKDRLDQCVPLIQLRQRMLDELDRVSV